MKQQYDHIRPSQGAVKNGICRLRMAPREWVDSFSDPSFDSNHVATPLLRAGKNWININLVYDTYEFQENPKISRGGTFFEVTISGRSNTIGGSILQTLETFRYHEFVVLATDRSGKIRIVGNATSGLIFNYSLLERSGNGGNQTVDISLAYQSEYAAPFLI